MKSNKGFTLIELVVVIVILGILAAVAAPKFMDLQKDARMSAIQGLNGAIKSAVNMSFAKSIVQGTDRTEEFAGAGVTTCPADTDTSTVICTVYGNPAAQKHGIIEALQNEDSFQTLTAAGACDSTQEWCYYSTTSTTYPKTIYFAPASSVGYTGTENTSCALKYTITKDTAKLTSSVTTTVLSEGC